MSTIYLNKLDGKQPHDVYIPFGKEKKVQDSTNTTPHVECNWCSSPSIIPKNFVQLLFSLSKTIPPQASSLPRFHQ